MQQLATEPRRTQRSNIISDAVCFVARYSTRTVVALFGCCRWLELLAATGDGGAKILEHAADRALQRGEQQVGKQAGNDQRDR